MSYGLDNYVNNKVSAPDSFKARYLRKRRIWFRIVFISALDKVGMDVKTNRPICNLFSPGYGIRM